MTTKSVPNADPIGHLRAVLEQRRAHAATIDQRVRTVRERLTALDRDIPAAIADADVTRAGELRAERAALEAEARDLGAAAGLAQQKADDAMRELAREEMPARFAAFAAEVQAFNAAADDLHRRAVGLLERRRAVHHRFTEAGYGHPEPLAHPMHVNRALGELSPVASSLYRQLRELSLIPAAE
jgi:hypothetical protein